MILIDGKEWRPISFVDELIRAILADLKTETRRIVSGIDHDNITIDPLEMAEKFRCPYGKAGDFLWIRERFVAMKRDGELCKIKDADAVVFRDGFGKWKDSGITFQVDNIETKWTSRTWRPPMHLPHWAHRIDLEVKSIKVERLQAITEAGAIAEGFTADDPSEDRSERTFNRLFCPQCGGLGIYPANSMGGAVFDADCTLKCDTARGKFRIKWDAINGSRKDASSGKPMTWDFNPLVWVVNFERIV